MPLISNNKSTNITSSPTYSEFENGILLKSYTNDTPSLYDWRLRENANNQLVYEKYSNTSTWDVINIIGSSEADKFIVSNPTGGLFFRSASGKLYDWGRVTSLLKGMILNNFEGELGLTTSEKLYKRSPFHTNEIEFNFYNNNSTTIETQSITLLRKTRFNFIHRKIKFELAEEPLIDTLCYIAFKVQDQDTGDYYAIVENVRFDDFEKTRLLPNKYITLFNSLKVHNGLNEFTFEAPRSIRGEKIIQMYFYFTNPVKIKGGYYNTPDVEVDNTFVPTFTAKGQIFTSENIATEEWVRDNIFEDHSASLWHTGDSEEKYGIARADITDHSLLLGDNRTNLWLQAKSLNTSHDGDVGFVEFSQEKTDLNLCKKCSIVDWTPDKPIRLTHITLDIDSISDNSIAQLNIEIKNHNTGEIWFKNGKDENAFNYSIDKDVYDVGNGLYTITFREGIYLFPETSWDIDIYYSKDVTLKGNIVDNIFIPYVKFDYVEDIWENSISYPIWEEKTYSINDVISEKGKIYICQIDGTQTGTFEDNILKWKTLEEFLKELNSIDGKISLGNTEIGMFGHHIYSLVPGGTFKTVYAGTPVSDSGSNGTVYMPSISAKETRFVTHGNPADSPEVSGNFTYSWIGTSYNYNAVPIQGYVLQGIYYKTGSVAATAPVRVRFFKGYNETGVKIFDKIYPASDFPANSEVHIIFPDLDYAEGQEFHGLLSSDVNFSLITNEGNASPWRAVDRQLEEHIALLPADLVFPAIEQVSPAASAVGIELQPTMQAVKGIARHYLYCRKSADQLAVVANIDITLDVFNGNLTYTSTTITLPAGGEYKLKAYLQATKTDTYGGIRYAWVDNSNVKLPEGVDGVAYTADHIVHASSQPVAVANITTTVDTVVKLRCTSNSSAVNIPMDSFFVEIEQTDTQSLNYTPVQTQVQIKRDADQVIVSDRTLDGNVSVPTLVALSGATPYHWRVRHLVAKGTKDIPLPWSGWRAFKTVFNMTININTSVVRNGQTLTLVSGDLIELNVGESVNASGFNLHLSNEATEFPSVAYQSGGLRFRDSISTELSFMVYSVTGVTPNRTAKCFIEVNQKVIDDKKLVLTEEVS